MYIYIFISSLRVENLQMTTTNRQEICANILYMQTEVLKKQQSNNLHTCSIPTELGLLFASAATPLLSGFTGTFLLKITSKTLTRQQQINIYYRLAVNESDLYIVYKM